VSSETFEFTVDLVDEGDISVDVSKPQDQIAVDVSNIYGPQGITPTGSIEVTDNGTYDVTSYASANVSVPKGITPAGTIYISENGTYDVTNYASTEVSVTDPEVTITASGAVTQELQPGVFYHFTSAALTSLTVIFGGGVNDQYHFDFISPSTAVTLNLPASVSMESHFSVEVNTKYEIDIYNGAGVFAEWVYGS
jgi:hypothetical protein